MEKKEVEQIVLNLITELSGKENCLADMDLIDEIGLSSVEVMGLVSGTERRFGVKIASRELRMDMTPADLAELVCGKLKG